MTVEPSGGRVVCLGEALVDFVCERPVPSLGDADSFAPRVGGSLANIAICAARFGARAEMLGGAGDDEWGRWLRERIAGEGVEVARFVLMPGAGTSHAFVTVDEAREPTFAFYGDEERPAAHAGDDIDPALGGEPGVLVVGSDTLLGEAERDVTMRAVALGRGREWRVLCDPNLRPRRWADDKTMLATIRELVVESSVVKCNEAEAVALAGVDDPALAGQVLCDMGPEAVVVTQAERGALLVTAGEVQPVSARPTEVVDTTGAGDCVAGVVAAGLAAGVAPAALAGVAEVAMAAAASVVATWGATEGLPPPAEARAALAAAA
jgi:sugar/nucleoside kinase (ribokinase family)